MTETRAEDATAGCEAAALHTASRGLGVPPGPSSRPPEGGIVDRWISSPARSEALKKGGLLGARTLGARGPAESRGSSDSTSELPRGVSSAPKESKDSKAEPAKTAEPAGAEPSTEKAPKKEKSGKGRDGKDR